MTSMNEPADMIVYQNLEKFIKYRGIKTDYKFLTIEAYSSLMNTFQYICIPGTYERKFGNNTELIHVYIFLIQQKSKYEKKTDEFKKLINRLVPHAKNKYSEVIYITEQYSTSYMHKKIDEYKLGNVLEILPYTYENFILVLPECECSSKHEIASQEEVNKQCGRLLIDVQMLPKIPITDAQLVWIGARMGDIIKITSRSETAGEVIEYRLCE